MRHGGHQDLFPGERELYGHFLATGEIDLTLLGERPISFKPKVGVALIVKLGLGAVAVIVLLLLSLGMRINGRRRGRAR